MKVTVRLFAVARQLAGRESVELEVPEGATVAQLRAQLSAEIPDLAAILPHVLFAAGSEYARDADALSPGTAVACIPPVSGG